jgi:PAS domain S-box-containing protein
MKFLKSIQHGQQLRVKAEERLKGGNPPPARAATTEAQALALLHNLASSPASAGDALKLLHELQVHQVELDLQHEHVEEDRQLLDAAMQSYVKLFDAAPFGYLTLDAEGRVAEANHIAAAWLGGEREQSAGHLIEDLVHAEDRLRIHELLRSLHSGGGRQKCLLRSKFQGDAVQAVISATSAAIGAPVLLAFMPAD